MDVAVPCPHPINVGIVVLVGKGRSLMDVVINTGSGPVCGMVGQLAFCFRDTGNNSSSHMDAKRAADVSARWEFVIIIGIIEYDVAQFFIKLC